MCNKSNRILAIASGSGTSRVLVLSFMISITSAPDSNQGVLNQTDIKQSIPAIFDLMIRSLGLQYICL